MPTTLAQRPRGFGGVGLGFAQACRETLSSEAWPLPDQPESERECRVQRVIGQLTLSQSTRSQARRRIDEGALYLSSLITCHPRDPLLPRETSRKPSCVASGSATAFYMTSLDRNRYRLARSSLAPFRSLERWLMRLTSIVLISLVGLLVLPQPAATSGQQTGSTEGSNKRAWLSLSPRSNQWLQRVSARYLAPAVDIVSRGRLRDVFGIRTMYELAEQYEAKQSIGEKVVENSQRRRTRLQATQHALDVIRQAVSGPGQTLDHAQRGQLLGWQHKGGLNDAIYILCQSRAAGSLDPFVFNDHPSGPSLVAQVTEVARQQVSELYRFLSERALGPLIGPLGPSHDKHTADRSLPAAEEVVRTLARATAALADVGFSEDAAEHIAQHVDATLALLQDAGPRVDPLLGELGRRPVTPSTYGHLRVELGRAECLLEAINDLTVAVFDLAERQVPDTAQADRFLERVQNGGGLQTHRVVRGSISADGQRRPRQLKDVRTQRQARLFELKLDQLLRAPVNLILDLAGTLVADLAANTGRFAPDPASTATVAYENIVSRAAQSAFAKRIPQVLNVLRWAEDVLRHAQSGREAEAAGEGLETLREIRSAIRKHALLLNLWPGADNRVRIGTPTRDVSGETSQSN